MKKKKLTKAIIAKLAREEFVPLSKTYISKIQRKAKSVEDAKLLIAESLQEEPLKAMKRYKSSKKKNASKTIEKQILKELSKYKKAKGTGDKFFMEERSNLRKLWTLELRRLQAMSYRYQKMGNQPAIESVEKSIRKVIQATMDITELGKVKKAARQIKSNKERTYNRTSLNEVLIKNQAEILAYNQDWWTKIIKELHVIFNVEQKEGFKFTSFDDFAKEIGEAEMMKLIYKIALSDPGTLLNVVNSNPDWKRHILERLELQGKIQNLKRGKVQGQDGEFGYITEDGEIISPE